MSDKYRKKPVIIEAVQWNGNNVDEVMGFVKSGVAYNIEFGTIDISTLEGTMAASTGDWIIKGVKDEFYPCKPDIFDSTYEKVSDTKVISDHAIDWMK